MGVAKIVLWRDEEDRVTADKPLYEQLEAIIRDVGRGMPFRRAVKANDFGLAAAKQRYYKGEKLLECYREYNAMVEDNGVILDDVEELFDKYDLAKGFRFDIDLIPKSISVVFYIKINKAQGDFIRELISKIKDDSDTTGNKLNFNATWLLSRVYAGDFGEALRGAVDIDIGVSDKARGDLTKALDNLMESKNHKFQQGNCNKTDNHLKQMEAKIESGVRLESD